MLGFLKELDRYRNPNTNMNRNPNLFLCLISKRFFQPVFFIPKLPLFLSVSSHIYRPCLRRPKTYLSFFFMQLSKSWSPIGFLVRYFFLLHAAIEELESYWLSCPISTLACYKNQIHTAPVLIYIRHRNKS
jgi:hypothetical protein